MPATIAKFGPFEFNLNSGELTKHGVALSLQNQSRLALKLLLEEPGKLVTRDRFIDTLWKDVNVDFENGLNTTIARLRQTLGPEYGRRIKAEPKQGYWFDTAVTFDHGLQDDAPAKAEATHLSTASPAGNTFSAPQVRIGNVWLITGMAALLCLCLLFLLISRFKHPGESAPHVAQIQQISNDGLMKTRYIAAGENRIYLNEMKDRTLQLFNVGSSGGTPQPAAKPFSGDWPDPQDTNSDNSDLLVRVRSGLVIWSPISNVVRRISPLSCDLAKWSPDYRRIACAVEGSLYTMNADGSQQRLLRQVAVIEALAWSTDGQRIRVSGREQPGARLVLQDIDTRDGRTEEIVSPEGGENIDGLFIRNTWLFISGQDNDIYARSSANSATRLTHGPIQFYSLASNPEGSILYAIGQRERGELMRYDQASKEWRSYLDGVSADCLTWSNDGKYVAYVTYPDRELWRSRADGSEPLQLTSKPVQVYHPSWSPDGSRIAYEARSEDGPWRLMTIQKDGGPPQVLTPNAEPKLQQREPVWSPDGRTIAFAPMDDATPADELALYLLDLKSGQIQRLPGTSGLFSPRWAPDQSGLLALTRSHEIVYYNLRKGDLKRLTNGHKAWPHWTNGGKEVCFLDGAKLSIGCMNRAGGPVKEVTGVPFAITGNTFSGTWSSSYWASFMPDDTPVLLRNRSLSEIYAIRLDWH